MRKKSIEDLQKQIAAQEERLRKAKAELSKATEAEYKKQSAEIIAAVDEWNESQAQPIDRSALADYFRQCAERNRAQDTGAAEWGAGV